MTKLIDKPNCKCGRTAVDHGTLLLDHNYNPIDESSKGITEKELKELGISVNDLAKAFVDMADSGGEWYNIQHHTGLPDERCKELSAMFGKLVKRFY